MELVPWNLSGLEFGDGCWILENVRTATTEKMVVA
jgi:hypothetical protein